MKRSLLLLAAVLLIAAGGCVSGSDVEQLEDQIIDLHDEVTELKRDASSKAEVDRINETLATQGGIEQANYRIDRLMQQINQNEKDIAALRLQVMQLLAQRGGSAPSSSISDSPALDAVDSREVIVSAAPPMEDPLILYQTAYRDYQRGNYPFAIEGFQDFLDENPSSDLADNAAYWIGESHYSQQKYRDAIRQLDEVINRFPQSDKVPAALLKKGLAYIELGEKAQGIVQLQYVIHEHPGSPEASLAREKLTGLGIDTR